MIKTLKISTPKICLTMSKYDQPVIYFCIDIRVWNKVYDRILT